MIPVSVGLRQTKHIKCLIFNLKLGCTSSFISYKCNLLRRSYIPLRWIKQGFNIFKPNSRNTSTSPDDDDEKPKLLMNFSPVIWPNMFLSIKNWILTKLIIQPYFDDAFGQREFTSGAKQALVHVSTNLAQGNFKALEELLATSALSEIQSNYASLSMKQRQDLKIKLEDIFFCFLYQIGIIMEEDSNKRFVEIVVVYHCLHGLEDIREEDPTFNSMFQRKERISICNYRFIREYTKGVNDNWTINRLNHFKPTHFSM